MERCDADQEGITLPPLCSIRSIARDETNQALMQHLSLCPLASDSVIERLRTLETRVAFYVGLMIGTGMIGGTVGAALTRLFAR